MSRHRFVGVVWAVSVAALLSSCSFVERKGVDTLQPVLKHTVDNLMGFQSASVAKEGLPGNVLLISALVEFSPNNDKLLAIASEAYAAWGLILEWEDPNFAAEIYEIGRDYGLRALKVRNREIRKGLETGKHMIDLAQYLKKGDVPAAFWYGLNAGLRVMLEMDDPNILIGIGDATRTFDRLIVLDDTYFNYAPHLFQGAYAIIAGPMLGGGTEKAKNEFAVAFKKTESKFLLAHVFYARYYATGVYDEALFDKTIDFVLKTPANVMPEMQLANDISKRKALWLKNNKNKFF
jgi:hypothetical protein